MHLRGSPLLGVGLGAGGRADGGGSKRGEQAPSTAGGGDGGRAELAAGRTRDAQAVVPGRRRRVPAARVFAELYDEHPDYNATWRPS